MITSRIWYGSIAPAYTARNAESYETIFNGTVSFWFGKKHILIIPKELSQENTPKKVSFPFIGFIDHKSCFPFAVGIEMLSTDNVPIHWLYRS